MAKIAIVLNTAWNVYNFRLPLLKRLEEDGHEVIVFAPADEYTPKIPYPCYSIKIKPRSRNPFLDLLAIHSFQKLLRRTGPDILLLYTIKPNVYGNIASRLLGIKTISNIAGLGSVFAKDNALLGVVKRLYWLTLKWPEKVFFQNSNDRDFFLEEKMVTAAQTELLPGSGVDLRRFHPVSAEEQGTDENFIFLLPARMLWSKGISEYVTATSKLLEKGYQVECRLVGFLDINSADGITSEQMKTLADEPGIVYRGVTNRMEVEMRDADCVVLPTAYPEGTPKALLEAAAMGKPIIASDAPGCRDVVDDGVNGYLCQSKDADDLFLKMEKVIQLNSERRWEMGLQGRKKMEQEFDQEIVIARYRKAVADILN